MEPITTTVAGACECLGLGQTKVWQLIKSGELQSIRVGRRRLVTLASINEFVAARIS